MSDLSLAAEERFMRARTSEPLSDKFDLVSGGAHATHAIILVGGIHDSYHYFDKWAESMDSDKNLVLGYDHVHEGGTMRDGAHQLADAIRELKDINGIKDVTVVAHSMGGLVAKGAIDELHNTGDAKDLSSLDLHALGTPWGGFALAEPVLYLPGGAAISEAIGLPMGPEMAPSSEFMKGLGQEMPPNGELHIYRGTDDNIATPEVSITKSRYEAMESKATSIVEIEGFGHDDYNKAPSELLEVGKGEPMHGYQTVEVRTGTGPDQILASPEDAKFGSNDASGQDKVAQAETGSAAAEMSMGGD